MHLPHELNVVLSVTTELEAVRLKIVGHPRDVSLVESYLRSRIPELIEIRETVVEREFMDPRPLLTEGRINAKN